MKKIYSIFTLLVIALVGLSLTGCSEDDLDTNQFGGGVRLNAFGPSPVMRGGQLRFIGSNLDQIREVRIPGVSPITSIEVVKAGVPSEIRVTVPKDGPEEGFVTIVANDDREFTTITKLTYTEPIIIETISPMAVMPGEEISIKGDYLNLIHMVEFADGVRVSENNFTAHDRYEIKLLVPAEARTGKLNLYTADLLVEDNPNDVSYNIITTEEAVEIGTPTVSKVASPRGEAAQLGTVVIKQGETLTVTGSYMKLAKAVKFGDVEVTDITVSEDGKSVSLTLPAEAPDGDVNIVCQSDVEVPVCTIETVAPTNCVAAPAPVKAGMALTITGNDMDVVEAVEMPNVTDAIEIEKSSDKVVVKSVPATATEGNLVLRMKNGKGVEVPFTLVKPTVTGYDNASVSAGGALVIKGTDLDLVKSVKFGDSDEVTSFTAQTAESITLTVPMNAQSGAPTLTLANGTTVANVPELNVSEAVFCYVTEWPGDDVEVKAGETITVKVANGDKLTGVEIKGQACQFVLSGQDKSQLVIGVPQNAGKGSDVRLISSNGEISYKFDFIPQGEITNVIFNGPFELTWGTSTQGMIPQNTFADLPAGAEVKLNVDYTVTGADPKMKVNNGAWGHISLETGLAPAEETLYSFDPNATTFSIAISAEAAANITANSTDWGGCLIIHGQDAIINKIYLTIKQSLEIDVAPFSTFMGDNAPALSYPVALSWGDDMGKIRIMRSGLAELGLKVGKSKLIFYKPAGNTGQIQLNDANWSNPIADGELNDWNGDKEVIEAVFTEKMMKCVTGETSDGWSETAFIIQGDGLKLTKITVLP